MASIKFDTKDRRILDALDKDPNITLNEIAKKVALSKQVVDYRIKRLEEQKTIYAFYTLIDGGKLGYAAFRVHIKLKSISEEKYSSFAQQLFEHYPTFWVGFTSGSFDIIIDFFAKSIYEFHLLFIKILQEHQDIILSYEIFPILELHMHNYGYFLDKADSRRDSILFVQQAEKSLDEIDVKILQIIKSNSRIAYEEIGRMVKLTRNAVKHRIEQLEKTGIIAGYQMMIDFKHFERLSYKIFIQYDHSQIQEEPALMNFIKHTQGILAHTKLLGRWNLDIEIQPTDAKALQQFTIELRNRFRLIADYELIQILEDYGIDFFPKKLKM